MSGWNEPEHVELLKKLHADGKSRSEIALVLNRTFKGAGYTRNSVIGKLNRLGASFARASAPVRVAKAPPAKPYNPAARTPLGVKAQMTPAALKTPPASGAPSQNNGLSFGTGGTPVVAEPTPIRSKAFAPLPGIEPVNLLDVHAHHCRWPIDLPGDDFHFCGAKAFGTYCLEHQAMAAPPSGTKENVDRRLGIAPRRRAA